MKKLLYILPLFLLASCSTEEVDVFSLLEKEHRTESTQTREEDNNNDSLSFTIGIVLDTTEFEEEIEEIHWKY